METKITLQSIFSEGKEKLANELQGLTLPKDASQLQKVVAEHLNELFANENAYRQSLTVSEDYILLSAIQLLQAQQSITEEIAKSTQGIRKSEDNAVSSKKNVANPYYMLVGTGVGALAGGLIGTWVAVAGAIAGTAVAIYYTTRIQPNSKDNSTECALPTTINAEAFIKIVEDICECLDNVIETYRVQVKKVQSIYEQREQPSLQKDYSILLEQIERVCNTFQSLSTSVPAKLAAAIEALAEGLENYGLRIENGKVIKDK